MERISKSELGVKLEGDIKIPGLAYADDIVLVAEREEEMNNLLKVVEKAAEELELKFGINKCKAMTVNGSKEADFRLRAG